MSVLKIVKWYTPQAINLTKIVRNRYYLNNFDREKRTYDNWGDTMQFLDVKTDFAFKKVFGSEQSKEILIDFLNAIIDFEDATITDLTIVDPYQVPLLKGMKDS